MSILRRKPRVRTSPQPPTVSVWLDFNTDGATTLAKLETLCAELRRHGAGNKQPIYGMSGVPGHVSGLSAHVPWHTYPHDRGPDFGVVADDYDLDFDETGRPL